MEAFAVPILPDKTDVWKAWMDELNGARRADFEDMNARHELTTHAAWLQANPDGSQMAIVATDGPGASTFLPKIAASDHEFDAWFRSKAGEVHPVHFSEPPPANPRVL